MHKVLQPEHWAKPRGYSNGMAARGLSVHVAGQVGWNAQCQFESDDFAQQTRQALINILAVLKEAQAGPEHIVRMTWYVTSKKEYLAAGKAIGASYRELMRMPNGECSYPAMTAIEVTALIEDRAKLEIEVTAMIPDQ
jgi:enamine deaminase RidA (YjgF/YER057c/UK114 family)